MHYLKAVRSRFDSYHLKSGIFHLDRGELKQAADFFKRTLREDGLHPHEERTARSLLTQAYLGWSQELQRQGETDGAQERIEAALAISPGFADLHLLRGRLLEQRGAPERAREAYGRALASNPRFVEARLRLGYLLFELGSDDDAIQELERALLEAMRKLEAPFYEGKRLLAAGQRELGLRRMERAFRQGKGEAHEALARAREALGKEHWEEAAEHLERVVELEESWPDVHNELGIAYHELSRSQEAEAGFRRSFAINPAFLPPRLNLAVLLMEDGRRREAEEALDEVLGREGDHRPALQLKEALRASVEGVERKV